MKKESQQGVKKRIKKEESSYQIESDQHRRSFTNQHNKRGKWKGKWTLKENQIFLNYLMKKKQTFSSSRGRRSQKIFCKLTHYLGYRRTPQQCRRYFQKISEIVGSQSIEDMIKYLGQKMRWQKFQKNVEEKKQGEKTGFLSSSEENSSVYKISWKDSSEGREIQIKFSRRNCFVHW